MFSRYDINLNYQDHKHSDRGTVISPDAVRLLRGLLGFTPQKLAGIAGVKKNKLEAYERHATVLSARDKRWLTAVFEVAGAEIFIAQERLQVTFEGEAVIDNGEVAERLKNLKKGVRFRNARLDADCDNGFLSQRKMQQLSGMPQHVISAIENNRSKKYHLRQLVEANEFLNTFAP